MSPAYRPPSRISDAALDAYASAYGASVGELDRRLGAAPAPADLIDLTHGDTRAFTPPPSALEDFAAGLAENSEAYTPYRGSAAVRRSLAPRLEALGGRPVDPAREVIITPGSQGALFAALSALVSPGDVVALPDPDYFANERIVASLGGRVLRLATVQDDAGSLRIAAGELDAASGAGARLLLCSNPNNPTGGVYAPAACEELARFAVANDVWCVIDELYCRLLYGGARFVHIASLPGMAERTVTLFGPSKTESMSGFRVGAAVAPAEVVDAMERVLSLASIRAAGYSQQALRHWLEGDGEWLAERVAAHESLRDKLLARLRGLPGVQVATPAGSSYVFPDVSGTPLAQRCAGADGRPADDFAIALALKGAGVLVSPGYQFGPSGRGHFRINFSQHADRLDDALSRIEATLTG
jgi:aspartate/methionine/tyrosine aminotransferase